MATAMIKCRVCGKEYPACHSLRRGDTTFRWQEVACSPECGAEYLRQINISRGIVQPDNVQNAHPEPDSTPVKIASKKRSKKGDAEKAVQE
jgi:hypothetical protein